MTTPEQKKEAVRRLFEDVMPNGRFDELDELVEPTCTTRRGGFADLMAARGVDFPSDRTFRQRFEAGWKPMSEILRDQRTTVEEISCSTMSEYARSSDTAPARNPRMVRNTSVLTSLGDPPRCARREFGQGAARGRLASELVGVFGKSTKCACQRRYTEVSGMVGKKVSRPPVSFTGRP
ncbi:hypothetical protein ACFQ1S_32265 [Kibdelosporangium lantanae]|uniref:Uncharacterized protein n=1 Tax=Kibdelosporangium lantanae TaxID=1497396 RepID=A0ABW3MGT6_9PSEU